MPFAIASEPYPICWLLDDVVFVALTCKSLHEAMVSVLEQQRAVVAAAYGVGLPHRRQARPQRRDAAGAVRARG